MSSFAALPPLLVDPEEETLRLVRAFERELVRAEEAAFKVLAADELLLPLVSCSFRRCALKLEVGVTPTLLPDIFLF